MIDIYARTFMTAARSNCVDLRDAARPAPSARKRRWLPQGHWWLKSARCVDLDKL